MLAKSHDDIDTSPPLSAFKTLFTISFYISELIFFVVCKAHESHEKSKHDIEINQLYIPLYIFCYKMIHKI